MPPVSTPFFLIRHGETDWNREGRLQGQSDTPLNARGRDQASAAGRSLRALLRRRGVEPAQVAYVASPLARARATMERVRLALDLQPAVYDTTDDLKELSFGAWEGRTWRELKTLVPEAVRARKADKWRFVPPGGESYAMLGSRLSVWLATVEPHSIVVTHGGVARVLMQMLAGCLEEDAPNIDIHQGRVLTFDNGRFRWD